ncbi:hypothetical protein Droror1_Dr00022054 [Drosera rotundifolia]
MLSRCFCLVAFVTCKTNQQASEVNYKLLSKGMRQNAVDYLQESSFSNAHHLSSSGLLQLATTVVKFAEKRAVVPFKDRRVQNFTGYIELARICYHLSKERYSLRLGL